MTGKKPRLYHELASWFHLLTAPAQYAEEAAWFHRTLVANADRRPETLLELGSGGGNNASHLKAHFTLTLVDLSPAMMEVSRALNPECAHLEGDMRSLRLDQLFDAVFIHDALSYLTEEADLRATLETAYVHCRPGGVALFAPDYLRETFRPVTDHGGHDTPQRSLRYLEWIWDPDPSDCTYQVDFAYLLREADGTVRVEGDHHVCGFFARQTWLEGLAAVGFRARVITSPWPGELFVAVKPARK